jgi:hypothetical protein
MSDLSSEHEIQKRSPLHLTTKPATTQDLQILASVGRHIMGKSEQKSLQSARTFANWANNGAEQADTKQKAILEILKNRLKVPMSSGSRKEQPSVWPVVPMIPALQKISCFTRLTGNPWNPGAYVTAMIHKGATSKEAANYIMLKLKDKLGLEKEGEDAWATLLESNVTSMAQLWGEPQSSQKGGGKHNELSHTIDCNPFPARALCSDLISIIDLKDSLTRRQWISMMDSLLRMSCATEFLWVARANSELGKMLLAAVDPEADLPDEHEIGQKLVGDGCFLMSNMPFEAQVETQIWNYANERIFIREFLGYIQNKQPADYTELEKAGGLCTHAGIAKLTQIARKHGGEVTSIRRKVLTLIDSEPGFLRLKQSKSWPAQCFFFIDGVLSQRLTREPGMRHFDQGYWCVKSGPAKSAKWVFRPGPIGVLTMAHLAGSQNGGSATANGLVRQFSKYGIRVTLDEVTQGKVGQDLRHLGLVVDSPDAEGGMLIRSPFKS